MQMKESNYNFDFNQVETHSGDSNKYDLIPDGTFAKVRIKIIPGGHHDSSMGLDDGCPTLSRTSTSVYLNCEYTIHDGAFDKRKIFDKIGIFSEKPSKDGVPNKYGRMGRELIKAIIDSAYGFKMDDKSPLACQKRSINSFRDLDGLLFVVKIGIERSEDKNYLDKNVIRMVVTADHIHYEQLMNPRNHAAINAMARIVQPQVVQNVEMLEDEIPF